MYSIAVALLSLSAIAQNRFVQGKNTIDSETFESNIWSFRLFISLN